MKTRSGIQKIDALSSYLRGLRDCPPLTRDEEIRLAHRLRNDGDAEAAHCLVRANLRAVVKIASRYQRPDVGLLELIQEGNLGLLQAVNRFDPDRGVRLVTYASWWIRAYVQRYLQGRQHHIGRSSDEPIMLGPDREGEEHHHSAHVPVREVSLDQPITSESRHPLSALIADESPDQESQYLDHEAEAVRHQWVTDGMGGLDPQERQVIMSRYLREQPRTLKEIGEELGLSRQRIHQIELKARRKLGEALKDRPVTMFV
jgi:RNA polymerase sigma-32 factor